MNDAQRLAETVVATMLANDAFSRWLGLKVLQVEPGRVSAEMTVRPEMLNGFGVCHGGVLFSFADSVLAFASNTHGRLTVSIENNIAYPAKVLVGDRLHAVCEELSASRRIANYQVVVTKDGGERVGLFRGTVYRTEKPIIEGGLPAK